MLSYLIADDQKNWDEMLMHAVAAHNNNVSRGSGPAPDEVHIGRYPRLPMTILEGRGEKSHQGLKQDQMDYLELSTNAGGRSRLGLQRARGWWCCCAACGTFFLFIITCQVQRR